MKNPNSKLLERFLPVLLIPLGFLLYRVALGAPFVYDDKGYILQNHVIKSLSNFIYPTGTRYVGFLSFALNYAVGGYNAFDYHLVNIAIHIANALLVYGLVKRTFSTPVISGISGPASELRASAVWLAFLSSVFFLAHPVNTQAVSYVTQRFASLATLFYLLSLYMYVRARLSGLGADGSAVGDGPVVRGRGGGRLFYAVAFASALLAMKTKEISFTLPFVIALYDFCFFRSGWRVPGAMLRIPFYLTLFIIPLSLLIPAEADGPEVGVAEVLRRLQITESVVLSRYMYVATQFRVIVTYIRLLLMPAGQTIDYDYPLSASVFEPAALVSLIFLVALFAVAAYVLVRADRKKNAYAVFFSFGIFWFFITLSVESFMVPIQDVIFEHRVYLPGIGFILAAVSVALWAGGRVRERLAPGLAPVVVPITILVLVCPPLFGALYKRNLLWTDELLLLDDAIEKSPAKARIYYARGALHMDRREYPEALEDADTAVRLYNNRDADMFVLRGIAYAALEMYEESFDDFDAALRLAPFSPIAYYNRALSHDALGNYIEALADYSKSIVYDPKHADAYNNRGVVYSRLGQMDLALADVSTACRMGFITGCSNVNTIVGPARTGSGQPAGEGSDERP